MRTALATRIVDHAAIAHNVRTLLAVAARPVMAVVKADAFGHGAVQVAVTAVAAGATWLGVATLAEALELRDAAIESPTLAWLVDADDRELLEAAVARGISLSCSSIDTLASIVEASRKTGVTAQLHLELDTGMARGGATVRTWPELCSVARAAERDGTASVEGVWSHLAFASSPGPDSVARPVSELLTGLAIAQSKGLRPTQVHIANSAGALAHPSSRLTMIRAGAALYGIETVNDASYGLHPALRVTSRIIQLRDAQAGTGIGYEHSYRTSTDVQLALVPVGYGDGIPRALSGGGQVVIRGRLFPVRGRVSMDQIVVEVDSSVSLSDEVVLIGAGEGEPTILQWSELAQTIPHALLTGFSNRVVRDHRYF